MGARSDHAGMTQAEWDACDLIAQQINDHLELVSHRRGRVQVPFEYAPGLSSEMIQEVESRYEGAGWSWAMITEVQTFGSNSYIIELER